MKKILYIFICLLLSSHTYSQTIDKQFFTCDGNSFRGNLPIGSKKKQEEVEITKKLSGSMVYVKNDPKNIKNILDPVGFITFTFQTFQVCSTDPVQLRFQKECVSPILSSVKKISETGTLDKVTGSFWYENIYQYEGKTYWSGIVFNCKKVNSPVVQ